MSVQAIRGLILLLNLVLLGLIGWVLHATFVVDQTERFDVPVVRSKDYQVPVVQDDERQRQAPLYQSIGRVLDRPPPPPPPPAPVAPTSGPKADPRQIQVLAIQYSPMQDRSSALLNAPLANPKDPKFFQVNLDLGTPGLGFEAYKGVLVKAVTADEVILTDQQGAEVRLPGPRPKEGK